MQVTMNICLRSLCVHASSAKLLNCSCALLQICEAQLTLRDMVHICVDVARGCKHLEDMHFVHR